LLNAGPGVYEISAPGYEQFLLDLFIEPIAGRALAVCGRIEQMPFRNGSFDVVVCVGEVLSYRDPAQALSEFARVLRDQGLLIFDFPSSQSPRHWFDPRFGRAADIFTDRYNATDEPIWVYSPLYIRSLMSRNDFQRLTEVGTHTLSAVARRFGIPFRQAAKVENRVRSLRRFTGLADVITVVARKRSV
jgi:SAM-dependent methyltransferase